MKHWVIHYQTDKGMQEILVKGTRISSKSVVQIHQGDDLVASLPGEAVIFQEMDPDTWAARKRLQNWKASRAAYGENL